ncbi:hypothetical protein [uncultured Shewanella sp.]|uniref:hypothetical protein n=1 Tax=uncultured Shewanella sp. TaxID=173975 RepID=UPI002631D787|nr:hypothetical protein [uncultured Shewanella sp.]
MFKLSLLPYSWKLKSRQSEKVNFKKYLSLLLILITMISFGSLAQTWSQVIEGTYGGKLLKTSQGDMLITGEARFPIMSDMTISETAHPVYDFVYHLTPTPDILWAKSFSEKNDELGGMVSGQVIIEKKNGEYALLVEGHHVNEQHMAFFSHSGELLSWHAFAADEQLRHAIGTHDGGILVVGATQAGQGLVIKMNHKGKVKWQHVMDQDVTVFHHVVELASGDFILAGQSVLETGENTASIVKISGKNEKNREIWAEHLLEKELDDARVTGLALTQDEDVIISGQIGQNSKSWIANFSIDETEMHQNFIWSQDEEQNVVSQINDVIVTSLGNIVAVGKSDKRHMAGVTDYWVLGLSLKGNQNWAHYYGGLGNDEAFSVIEMNNDQLVISGYSSGFDITGTWVLSLNAQGEIDNFTPSVLQY